MATREEIFREQLEHIKEANNSSAPNGTPREALEAFIDFYSGMFPYLEPFFETMKGPILDTYDLLENRTETLNNYLDMLENEFNNGGGTSPGGETPGGGSTPGGTSPDGTTPGGGGGTSPNGHPLPYNPAVPQPHDPLVLDLNQAGVNTIELNVFATNINLNGNLLTEAGRYGDSTGMRSLAADVELAFDSRITTVDTSLIPDYTVHADAASLPKLRGYGAVYNSEIAYNVNENLRNLALSLTVNSQNFKNTRSAA